MSPERDSASVTLNAALAYASRGWPAFPVKEDKSPATPHGFKDASDDPEEIRKLWRQAPGAGVGIATGASSGLVVLDVDPDSGGEEALAGLEARHGHLPKTIEALTGGGGRHLYFAHPGGEVRCSAGKLGTGLDIRADGGYVVAPPSRHPSGRTYEWKASSEDTELAEAPDWIYGPAAERQAEATTDVGEAIEEGARNSELAHLAGAMRRPGMTRGEIEAALQVVNRERCRPPLEEAEVAGIAASVARYEPAGPAARHGDPIGHEPLSAISARELAKLPDPPAEAELVGPLLVRGARTVLGAQTGEGKTTFALELAGAAVSGGEFLGWEGSGSRVLVIDAEQGLRTIKRRLKETGLADSAEVDYLRAPDGLSLDQDGSSDVYQLQEILEEGEYDLVVADPLYKLHHGDSNEERHAVDLMRRLDAWRARFGFAMLLLVHRRKSQLGSRGFTMDDLFGSSAYLRGAEVVLGLERKRPGYSKLHFFKDRDGDLPVGSEWGLLFDPEEGFRRDPEDGKPKEYAIDKVRAALESEPGLSLDELVSSTGYTDRTVRDALKRLGADSKNGRGRAKRWYLPEGSGEGDQ